MKSFVLIVGFFLMFLCAGCSGNLAGGGGIETVALVVTLPASQRDGGVVVYNGDTVVVAKGDSTVTINVPKNDSIPLVVWSNGRDTAVIAKNISAPGGVLPKVVLLITGSYGPNTPTDSLLRSHLFKAGLVVVPLRDSLLAIGDTSGMNGICISTSIDQTIVGSKFRDSRQPILDCEYKLLDSLGISGGNDTADYGSRHPVDTAIVNGASPASAGYSGPTVIFSGFAIGADSLRHLDWGRLPAGAIATITDPLDSTKANSICMEIGCALPGGGTAAARRSTFLFATGDAGYISTESWNIFEALCRWSFNN